MIEAIKPLFSYLPEVKSPVHKLNFNEKLKWTGIILLLYFLLTQVPLYGLSPAAIDQFAQLRAVLAGNFGSIITLGIGPIVTASIVLQLLIGAKILNLNLSKTEDKAMFQGLQKILAILFTLFEAFVLIVTGSLAPISSELMPVMVLQLFIGGLIIIFLDEVVSKWGFGSGVGLFIAAGVAQTIVVGTFNFMPAPGGEGIPAGAIPAFIYSIITGSPNGYILIPVLATIIVFLVVVYAESMRIEIPVSMGRVKGAVGKYPLKFIYASNMPVIITGALLMNVSLFASVFQKLGFPILGKISQGKAVSGLAYFLSQPTLGTLMVEPLRVLFYAIVFIGSCILFGYLWVEITNLGPKSVSQQLHGSGYQIPGFRSSKKHFEKLLSKYIPTLTILSSAFVGILAFSADLTQALGGGTGVLLTVGIVYRLYEDIAKEQLMDTHPMLRKFLSD